MPLPQTGISAGRSERLVDVLARIHSELAEIAARIDRNQASIARATWDSGSSDEDYVRAMQDADLSAQRISGVADFLRALGDVAEPQGLVDTGHATGTLKLSELVRTIGASDILVERKNEEAAGDVDLF
jgi:hypothetical protein